MTLEKKRAFIIHFFHSLIWSGISFCILRYGLPMIAPFLLAFLIVSILHRPAIFISQKMNVNYRIVALCFLIVFYGCIGLLLSFLGIRLFAGCSFFFETLPQLYAEKVAPELSHILNVVESHILHMDISLFQTLEELEIQLLQSSRNIFSELSMFAVEQVTLLVAGIPGLFMKALLMIISSFFITVDYDRITGFCMKQLNDTGKTVFYQIKDYVVNTLFVCIRSYLLIMAITFTELMFGLWIIGVEHAVFTSLLISIFDILPVLGVGGVLIPWGIVCLLQSNYSMAIGLFILYIVILVIRNILEPKIVGKQIGLHPVVTLASMFVGVQLFGLFGLFGFPIGLSLLRHLNKTGTIHIFRDE